MTKYGATWPDNATPISIERSCIRKGGKWTMNGQECGAGLFHHYHEFQKLLWPWKDWHRWNLMMLEEIVTGTNVGVLGAASSGKTHEVGAYILSDYFCFPECTTALVSSTTLQMLDLRIWGEIKKLFSDAKERHPWVPGHLNETRHRITTVSGEMQVKDFRNGIQGIACLKGSTYVGLSNFAGIKNERLRIAGDELQFLPRGFLDAFQNLSKTPRDFKAIGMGNPKDPNDALGTMCEPTDGWDSADRTEKTKVWVGRMPNTRVVQLVGSDGPNKGSVEGKEPYPYLIKPVQIEQDRKYYGPNSIQFSMMDLGMMPVGGMSNRVITKAMCETNRAKEMPIFADKVTKVLGLDAAYGTLGGDRCVAIELWFGKDTEGTDIVAVHGLPLIVPVHFRKSDTPENQIVKWVRAHCENGQIAPGNVFFDSTGRGTLGTAFGRIWSTDVNPVEFGGNASERRVSGVDQRKCSEVYGKFVTELWYQVRNAIESKQFRGITDEIIDDGTCREYMMIDKKKVDVESKKITKQRMGRSPDIFDALVTAFEGARQRGFVISGLLRNAGRGPTLWQKTAEQYQQTWQRKRLTYGTKF